MPSVVAENSFTGKETVASLLNVVSVWIIVHFVGNLIDAG